MDLGIANLTENTTFDGDTTYTIPVSPLDVINAISAILAAIANIIIVFVISKSPILYTRTNIYLANWCFCNIFVLISAPTSLNLFGWVEDISYEILCVWDETLNGILFGNLIFVAVLLMDWYTTTYCQQSCATRCRNSYKFTITIIWLLIFVVSVISVTLCINNYSYPLTLMCFFMGYFIVFLLISIILLLRCYKIKFSSVVVEKSNLELLLVTSYFVCWLPNWLCLYGQLFLMLRISYDLVSATYFLGYSNACILLVLLYVYEKTFKKCFRETFGLDSGSSAGDATPKEAHNTMLL